MWPLILTMLQATWLTEGCEAPDVYGAVYLCRSTVSDSAFAQYSARVELCTDRATLVQILRAVDRYPQWLPDTESAELYEQSEVSQVHRIVTRTPWPMKSRDMIYRLALSTTGEHRETVTITGIPDYRSPAEKVVRMKAATGSWALEYLPDRTRVVFTLHMHPGEVPSLFADSVLKKTVEGALNNLRERFACPTDYPTD
jgi:hypothetical protein